MTGIWDTVNGVLQYPNIISQTVQVIQFQRWIAVHKSLKRDANIWPSIAAIRVAGESASEVPF